MTFLEAYRRELLARDPGLGPQVLGWLIAKIKSNLTGEITEDDLIGAMATAAWQRIGGEGKPTLAKLRERYRQEQGARS